ncbi:VOC family protein [Clostridium polynesiense]|uniref:VOC family protein n=1 Tax=Clostridium polynesiense TaxID=1325933 RepID=UPI00058DF845|nr:VOC family protein [Clostridium polynesiense]
MNFCWSTLSVKNMEESLRFYEEIVGLKVYKKYKAGPDIEIAFLGDGETKVELIYNKNNNNVNIGRDISLGFEVKSVDEMIKFIKEKGIAIESGPFKPNPTMKFFFIMDPNGLRIQFVENP